LNLLAREGIQKDVLSPAKETIANESFSPAGHFNSERLSFAGKIILVTFKQCDRQQKISLCQ